MVAICVELVGGNCCFEALGPGGIGRFVRGFENFVSCKKAKEEESCKKMHEKRIPKKTETRLFMKHKLTMCQFELNCLVSSLKEANECEK